MKSKLPSRFWMYGIGSLALATLIGVTTGVGAYVGNRLAQDRIVDNMPPIELQAGTAARTKSMSMATGLIDGNVEGLFVLDHVTGNLQCWMLSQKTGSVGGIFRTNVAADLFPNGKTAEPDYLMTTGSFFFTGGQTGNLAPGQAVCYVGDATSGNVVGYGIVYDKQDTKRGVAQTGVLKLVCKGTARGESVTRDQ